MRGLLCEAEGLAGAPQWLVYNDVGRFDATHKVYLVKLIRAATAVEASMSVCQGADMARRGEEEGCSSRKRK